MPISTDQSPAAPASIDGDLIDLEPTMQMRAHRRLAAARGAGVGLVDGSLASLSGEIDTLRRRRLGAAALFLTVACGALFLWFAFTSNDLP